MDRTETALSSRQPKSKGGDQDGNDDLRLIREQTRETVALLRQLIALMLPNVDLDKPKLEDLIAALVGQQATTILLCQQISKDLQIVLEHLYAPGSKPNGQRGSNGALRS